MYRFTVVGKPLNFVLMIVAVLGLQAYASAEEAAQDRRQEVPDAPARSRSIRDRQLDSLKSAKAVFQVLKVGLRSAVLRFNGWNSPPSNWHEDYTVDAGVDGNVRLAIVKKEIEIIRKYYSGDFQWISSSSGGAVTVSARVQDNDSLELFLMKEQFGN